MKILGFAPRVGDTVEIHENVNRGGHALCCHASCPRERLFADGAFCTAQ
jgi:hypothetical protein